ncbi:MAG: hypothetical protein JOS17DRAFT_768781, partial [Linnemannia elongata]
MPSTRRAPLTSTSTINTSSTATFTGYKRVKAANSTRSLPTKSVRYSPLTTTRRTVATKSTVATSSSPSSLPINSTITTPNAIASSSSSSSSISRCSRCRGNDHQRSTSRLCPYFKGKQTTSARINHSQKHHSDNCDYLETIFDTVSDESVLAALTDVVQDQDLNTTSQSTLVEDEESEDEPLTRRPQVWKNISNPEPTLATQVEDKARDDQERPLTQVIPTALQSPSSSYPSTMLDERTPPIPSTTRLNTTSGSMVVVCPSCSSKLSLTAVL